MKTAAKHLAKQFAYDKPDGEKALYHLIQLCRPSDVDELDLWIMVSAADVGKMIPCTHQKASRILIRLADAGLVDRIGSMYTPTKRGLQVDGILDRITAARGGQFQGRLDAGITYSESHALH